MRDPITGSDKSLGTVKIVTSQTLGKQVEGSTSDQILWLRGQAEKRNSWEVMTESEIDFCKSALEVWKSENHTGS